MPDKARIKTEKELAKMERKVDKIYSKAYKDISRSWNKFMDSHAPKLEKAYNDLQDAIKSGDKKAIDEAKAVYESTAKNITVNNQRFQGMVDETAEKLTHTNEVALAYVNGEMPKIYTTNYNAFGDENVKGYSFSLVNERAVKELATKDKALLPKKKIDVPKDMKWNEKNINSQMLQGILQGESIPKMAKRLMNVTDMNRNSAIRNARTMTTAAENKGRQDSYKKAQNDGVIMEREWVATHDERTREAHAELNGVRVGVDEAFDSEYGPIMYPGDPSADPANVYNCRCSIRVHVKGFKWNETAQEEQADERKPIPNFGNAMDILTDDLRDMSNTYAERMSDADIDKFNRIFGEAKYLNSSDGSHYNPQSNDISIKIDSASNTTLYHESTHWFDYNQDYTITADYGKYKWLTDENGDSTGEKVWQSDIVTIKEHAGFSEYIANEWDTYKLGEDRTAMSRDRHNFVERLGLSDTYGFNRNPEDVEHDVKAINQYLDAKNISRTDPDYVHLSDFISALSYDSSLGSLMTGGHSYEYWLDTEHQVTEITAGYNLLRATNRQDLLDVERELAPELMAMIEKEWKKIW